MDHQDHSSQRIMAAVLAGGKGSRMESLQPKSLHVICGHSMIWHIISALQKTSVSSLGLILGEHHYLRFSQILSTFPELSVCLQTNSLGTAHAVGCVGYMLQGVELPEYVSGRVLRHESSVPAFCAHQDSLLVCLGDTPALSVEVLEEFICEHKKRCSDLSLIAMHLPNPYGYGRILLDTDSGDICGMVEEKHASEEQKAITLCYSGVMLVRISKLFSWLKHVPLQPSKKEYYLTDIVAMAYADKATTYLHKTSAVQSFMGVNTMEQLRATEEYMRLMRAAAAGRATAVGRATTAGP